MKPLAILILAAGKGTRINGGQPSEKPKVLHEILGRPMICYVLDNLKKINLGDIYIVIGYKSDMVKEKIGSNGWKYVYQEEQLGTGHAVMSAEKYLKNNYENVLVMGGDDSAFYKPETLKNFVDLHQKNEAVITFLTICDQNPEGQGRILRDINGKIEAIVEEKEATDEQKKIIEVNIGCYCFKASWLWDNLEKIKKSKVGQEYYITDLPKIAIDENDKVETFKIEDQNEWIGINTPEQLEKANKVMKTLKESSTNDL